jgi:hypothetical protein
MRAAPRMLVRQGRVKNKYSNPYSQNPDQRSSNSEANLPLPAIAKKQI